MGMISVVEAEVHVVVEVEGLLDFPLCQAEMILVAEVEGPVVEDVQALLGFHLHRLAMISVEGGEVHVVVEAAAPGLRCMYSLSPPLYAEISAACAFKVPRVFR